MHPIDEVTDQVISAAIKVHKALGPGLLESVYNAALGVELVAMGLEVHVGKPISLDYEGLHLKRAYVVDLLVNNCVVVELKCVQKLTPVDVAQLLTYLRLLDIRVGLLINFNVTLLKHGIRRVVNRHVDEQGNKLPVSGKTATVDEVKERIDDNEPTKSPPRPLRPLRLPPSDANDAE